MRQYSLLILFLLNSIFLDAQTYSFKPPQNRVLVISGGGARGAWGVGVCKALLEKHHGYKAVYGTSTGSLMAPMILLQNIEKLEFNYTNVTQKSIFSLNPFKVTKEPVLIDGAQAIDSLTNTKLFTMKTDIKPLNAIWRLFTGKPSLGESYNLKKLIQSQFSREEYNRLQSICKTYDFEIGVGVTNMEDAKFEMIKNTGRDYDEFINYMWASANQPVFMTYYYDEKRKRHFADGGLIEVLPIRQAIDYAVKHKVDTIDVVLNSSINNIEPKDFSIRKNYISGGLMRILSTYGQSTLSSNIELGMLKATMESIVRDDYSEGLDRDIVINIYSMNRKLSQLYKDELGFDKDLMKFLLAYGYHSTHRILEPPALALTQPITNLNASPSPSSRGKLKFTLNE